MRHLFQWFKDSKKRNDNHSLSHSSTSVDKGDVSYAWMCNLCFSSIISGQVRYKSYEYKAFDLCESCYLKERSAQSQLFGNGMFLPEREHRFEIKERVNAAFSNQTLNNAFVEYSQRPCFGTLNIEKKRYEWVSYGQVHQSVLNFAAGLVSVGLIKDIYNPKERDFISICGKNSIEWFISDFACIHKSVVSVPIHFTLTVDDCSSIVENSGITTVICTSDLVEKFISVSKKCPTLKTIIEMGIKNELRDTVKTVNINIDAENERSINIYSFDYIEKQGRDKLNMQKLVLLDSENDLITLIYTSGSTGNPKGVMIPDRAWNFNLNSSTKGDPDVIFSFCPLAHMTDRKHAHTHICNGSLIAIFQRKLENIFEDIQIVRPTILVSTPRLWNVLYGEYQKQLTIATDHLDRKLESYQDDYKKIETSLLKEFKGMLGDRLDVIVTGGAGTSADVLKFLKSCYQCIVSNGFGTSETGGIANDGFLRRGVEYKLVDVPEMNYFTTDKPYPRGELCIKSPEMYLGYFNNEELTKNALDNEGFHHTGDIVQQKGDRKFEIIDRIKNIFKLAQGEFVSPESLENAYLNSLYVDQIYIYGNSLRSYVIAVIVPNQEMLFKRVDEYGLPFRSYGSTPVEQLEWLSRTPEAQNLFLSEFARIAEQKGFHSYEIPRGFILEAEPFTNENGKLTPLLKLARPKCEEFYKERLEQLYFELQEKETKAVDNELTNMFKMTIGKDINNVNEKLSTLGIDSLHAVKFANNIKKIYGIDISAKTLLTSTSLKDVADLVAKKKNATLMDNIDVNWESEATLDGSIIVSPEIKLDSIDYKLKNKKSILVTGVTGFLGAFLVRDLLVNTLCDIYCLVRVKEDAEDISLQAMQRIVSHMKNFNVWRDSFELRIKPIVGDLSKPFLGLQKDNFNTLAKIIDVVYHNGAHVNAMLSYESLKAVNVKATEDILRLAVTKKLKIVHYISTVGVLQGISRNGNISDRFSFDDMESKEQLYHRLNRIGGYPSSKWVAESLCCKAKERGIPITIFRPGMIGPDTESGVCNVVDWVVRFLMGCVKLQHYPSNLKRSLDWIPVDIASKVIISVSQANQSVQEVSNAYHITNPMGEVSFDYILDNVKHLYSNMRKTETFHEWLRVLSSELQRLQIEEKDQRGLEELLALEALFKQGFPKKATIFSNENTMHVLQLELGNELGLLPYNITQSYILASIKWLQSLENGNILNQNDPM